MALSPLSDNELYLAIGADVDHSIEGQENYHIIERKADFNLIKTTKENAIHISHDMHHNHRRCGGYFAFENSLEAQEFIQDKNKESFHKKEVHLLKSDIDERYRINEFSLVNEAINHVDDIEIERIIRQFSSFRTRFHRHPEGQRAAVWLRDHWTSLLSHRSDASVELVDVNATPQDSVVATIRGQSDEVIVVGGHLDSIHGRGTRRGADAPGADDNASGIATITEIIRVLSLTNYVPEHTLKFIGYSAEEIGLIGSRQIARSHQREDIEVRGVLQLDMTNYQGSEHEIYLMTDYTNQSQNHFLTELIDTYVGVGWGLSSCGYACSDHASWDRYGFPASFPTESRFRDANPHIHSSRDTLEMMGDNAIQSSHFAKLGVSFVIELDR